MKIFSKSKSISEERKQLFFSIEKLLNVALVKTEWGDNQSVKEIMEELDRIFWKFWQLRKDDPDRFDAFLWSEDFYENYVKPLKEEEILVSQDSSKTKDIEKLKQSGSFYLSISADRALKGLTQFLNSFEKIWEAAHRFDNEEISEYVVSHLERILKKLTQEPSNEAFVRQILRLLHIISIKGIKSRKEVDYSIYAAAMHWYTSILFQRSPRASFDLSYLDMFNEHLLATMKVVITQHQKNLFHQFVRSLISNISIPGYYRGDIWDYGHFIMRTEGIDKHGGIDKEFDLERNVKEAVALQKRIMNKENYEEWKIKFDQLKEIVEKNVQDDQIEQVRELEINVRTYVQSSLKYHDLLDNVFVIGSYCLFKERYDFIAYLWQYKQPDDADANWAGHDIIPEKFNGVLGYLFQDGFFDRIMWDDHHGGRTYLERYFILLLARTMRKLRADEHGKYKEIVQYRLPDLDIHQLGNLEYSTNKLIERSKIIKNEKDVLKELGFVEEELDELFDNKIVALLETVKERAAASIKKYEREKEVSAKKIANFGTSVVGAFYGEAVIRNIFEYFCAYENGADGIYAGSLEKFGINVVFDKAAFLEDWNVHYGDIGDNFGRDMAQGEDDRLLIEIVRQCEEIGETDIDQLIDKFEDLSNIIIVANNVSVIRYFESSENFIPKWSPDIKKIDQKTFNGFYQRRGVKIPIFVIHQRVVEDEIILLDKTGMGKLLQHSPLDKGESENLRKDIFYFRIEAFSESADLLNEYLENPADWLEEHGDKESQKDYLLEKVLIQIFERYEISKSDNFKGYILKPND